MVEPLVVQAGSTCVGFVNAPSRLFKFFSQEAHARALVDQGQVRVGTLFEFRATDGWDAVRGDSDEGKFTFTLESAAPETITLDSAPWYLKPIIRRLGMPILSHGGTINAVGHHPNVFMYCATGVRTDTVLSAYGPYCVAIHDVVGFFAALTRHLTDVLGIAAREPHGFLAPCLYLQRGLKVESASSEVIEPPLAFIKPLAKRDEQEVRAIWHPAKTDPHPLITVCPELTKCCSLI